MTSRACLPGALGFGITALLVVDAQAARAADLLQIAKTKWTPLRNGNDSDQLLVDVTSIRSWKKGIRYAFDVVLIPKPHTMDVEKKKLIRYEQMEDRFNCSEGTASKVQLVMVYEDGSAQLYWPWGQEAPWRVVPPDTALSSEMKFVCALQLTSDSPAAAKLGSERIIGTWQLQTTQQLGDLGARIAGPIVISETQIAWPAEDEHTCAINYQLASRGTGPTFPGGPKASDKPDDAYTTYVLELGPHTCALGLNDLTVSFQTDQVNLAYFTGLRVQVGTMRRVSPRK